MCVCVCVLGSVLGQRTSCPAIIKMTWTHPVANDSGLGFRAVRGSESRIFWENKPQQWVYRKFVKAFRHSGMFSNLNLLCPRMCGFIDLTHPIKLAHHMSQGSLHNIQQSLACFHASDKMRAEKISSTGTAKMPNRVPSHETHASTHVRLRV